MLNSVTSSGAIPYEFSEQHKHQSIKESTKSNAQLSPFLVPIWCTLSTYFSWVCNGQVHIIGVGLL